jgi:3-hydroxy-9,10-secoandrosta-1,3,5(10)-triene-9,17-dione monooxygenase
MLMSTTAAEQDTPTRTELVARAASLRPLLEANAEQTDRDRRVVDENIEAAQGAGLFRITVPKRYGGYETDFGTLVAVAAELAKGCASTSWVVSLINTNSWLMAGWSKRVQDEIWADSPDARCVGVLAHNGRVERATGGLLVTGEWPWTSGIWHAQWTSAGVLLPREDGATEPGVVVMPVQDISVKDTWQTVGMRGTGSNTIVADKVFVPDHRVIEVSRFVGGNYDTEFKDEVLYRAAIIPVTSLILVGPLLGLASAALEHVLEKAPKRAITHTNYRAQNDSATFQASVAKAALTIDGAYLQAFHAAREIDQAAIDDRYPAVLERAHIRGHSGHVAQLCREAVDRLVSAHGASTFAESNKLQRIWRDLNVGSRHAFLNTEVNYEIYGKALMNVEPNITDLI